MPTQAPDLETILNIEDAVESAVKTVLQDYEIAAFMQRETADLPGERVDIQLRVGAPTGHKKIVKNSPLQFVDSSWNCELVCNLFTKRRTVGADDQPINADPATHGRYRARVRMAMMVMTNKLTEALMPYHVAKTITQRNTDPTVNVDDDLDVSSLTFDVLVSVRDGAWPATW